MKKTNTNETKENKGQYGNLGFYLVLVLCAVMIGVSCWFAYTQTSDGITIQLDSALDSVNDLAAAELQTNVPKPETEPPAATSSWNAAHVSPSTTEPERKPETAASESTAMNTETVTQTVSVKSAPTSPAAGEIIGAFSNGELVKSATTGVWQTHNGIDIAAAPGDAVYAAADGVVDAVEEDPLWGVCVTIDHQDGYVTRYCNLNTGLSVNVGDQVSAGTIIGAVGETADIESAIESHLHFEVLQGEMYLDPAEYLGK